ncbi:L-Ala-D/L-Glu epimerase, partial [Pantoea agglomerans]|nr:L-Ala-D/L-Glu epimerase [Pantoea agglomerans]
MRTVKSYPEAWPLHTPFVIARGTRTEVKVVVVEIEEDGVKGVGEATPYARYGESEASVLAQIAALLPALQQGMTREALQQALPAGAARNAIDSALWDLASHQQQSSLWQLSGV